MSKKLKVKKNNFLKIMSCYDATSATIANLLGCDAILVGDSTGILNLGYKNTADVNLKDLIEILKIIKKVTSLPIIADLPSHSLTNNQLAISHAKKLTKFGADIIKIEGHGEINPLVATLTKKNIAICTHIGITPQKHSPKNTPSEYARIAKEHEDSGAKLIVLSKMSTAANKKVSESVSIPLVGYKNTNFCNGKVDVMYAALGLLKGEEIKININQQSAAFKHLTNFFKKNS